VRCPFEHIEAREPVAQEVAADRVLVLELGDRVVGMRGREQPLEGRIRGRRLVHEQGAELPGDLGEHLAFVRSERHLERAVLPSTDRSLRHGRYRSFCIVAHRPYACSRATWPSHSSFVPFDTTAFPFVCTSIISFSAFVLG